MSPGVDASDVKAALSVGRLLSFYGWSPRRDTGNVRFKSCPAGKTHNTKSFCIHMKSGQWQCFPCGIKGDKFDVIAEREGLHRTVDFPKILTVAAQIAGLDLEQYARMDDAERRAHREAAVQQQREAEERERQQRAALEAEAVPRATAYWDSLPTRHPLGEAYLAQRGVLSVLDLDDVVRFDVPNRDDFYSSDGAPVVALRKRDGSIWNVVRRRFPALGAPKTPVLKNCPGHGTMVRAVHEIDHARDVVLNEGVFDTLTGQLAWPNAIVFGANGAGEIATIAEVIAPIVMKTKSRLILVPHEDESGVGYNAMREAGRIALGAGLRFRDGNLVVVSTGAKDLNAAWQSGWRAT